MSAGTISGNTASQTYSGSTYSARGGGVYSAGTFTMSGGTISDNTASGYYYTYGGGVYVASVTFTKSGASVIYGDTDTTHTAGANENTARNTYSSSAYGHAVYWSSNGTSRNTDIGENVNVVGGLISSSTPTALTADTWADGTLAGTDQEDLYSFTASSTGTYYLWLNSGYSSYGDGSKTAYTTVTVFSSTGSTVASLSYSTNAYSTGYSISVTSGETYYIKVTSYSSYTGTYAIKFTIPNIPAGVTTPTTLTSGTYGSNTITTSGGYAYFAFNVTSGTSYTVRVDTSRTVNDIYVSWAQPGSTSFGSQVNLYSGRLTTSFTATATGIMYFRVSAWNGSSTGICAIRVN
jgi:hypothetical protein